MPARNRPHPTIPDHEVLRIIGGGAYGEVWLARAVTGAMRAVKVVWREDFEDERGFEREFEGILKFEPISREHPGFVNILHVGRSVDAKSFYYYVMELADDVRTGRDINPIEYEPRTLRADHKMGEQWEVNECITVGLRLAEALGRLHEEQLAHRDVKPANVIFVNGNAKLADIGLVAARGQRTFVGTEGFVPPEGPGTRRADIYSLGKVLYEIATGKDRLCFPDIPDKIPDGEDGKRWRELNQIICDVCDPRQAKRKISTAAQLVEALTRIQRGKRRRRSSLSLWLTSLVLLGFAGVVSWQVAEQYGWSLDVSRQKAVEPVPTTGLVRVLSWPEGGDIYDASGVLIDSTPSQNITARIGEEVVFVIKKKGFRDQEVRGIVPRSAAEEPITLPAALQIFRPPEQGEPWSDFYGLEYQSVGEEHVSRSFVSAVMWKDYLKARKKPAALGQFVTIATSGGEQTVVLAPTSALGDFCDWLREKLIEEGYLTADHEIRPLPDEAFSDPAAEEKTAAANLKPFRLKVRAIPYGKLELTSIPEGAEVYVNGTLAGRIGSDPLRVSKVKPGLVELLFVREGYKPFTEKVQIGENELLLKSVTMAKNQGVVFGAPWENGLGMRFLPLGEDLMVSIWETRLKDYRVFVRESGHSAAPVPDFEQSEDHPVVNVSRKDAEAFCQWLTRRELERERIGQSNLYRLPTDAEWSLMAGVQEEPGTSPASRDAKNQREYPWGAMWENAVKNGNYADFTAAAQEAIPIERTIPGYDDGFAYTAPVGSFAANAKGIFDLGGNVQEWVSDTWAKMDQNNLGVLRGGGWTTWETDKLYTGSRNGVPPEFADRIYGFRVVLAKNPLEEQASSSVE